MARSTFTREHGFIATVIGDGRPLLFIVSSSLVLSGLFALFLAATKRFLPHDVRYLGLTAEQLCAVHGCRIVHFMIHDRIAFGGALCAIGVVYAWLTAFPLRQGEAWAWWLLVLTGLVGFGSFFAYLGYGYLDTWHEAATLALLPTYVIGIVRSRRLIRSARGFRTLLQPSEQPSAKSAAGLGRFCLLGVAGGMVVGGLVIMLVGMTCVFVPQDLTFMGLSLEELHAFNPRLVPLIAHDRAGFGGAVCCCGVALFFCVWCGSPSRSLWQTLALVGVAGFGTAVGAHPAVGYQDAVHLAPAVIGAMVYAAGLLLTFPRMMLDADMFRRRSASYAR